MRSAIVVVVVALALVASVTANTRKVLVLPVDGSAPAAQRTQVNAAIVSLAKAGVDGTVTAGETTFNDTAAAVGCNPNEATCGDTVLKTLSVDELVYGTANTENGSTTITIHRVSKDEPARQQIAVIDGAATGDQASGGLQPLFSREPMPVGSDAGSGSDAMLGSGVGSGSDMTRQHTHSFFDTRDRKIGAAFAGGGAVALIVGFSLWASESSVQNQIDNHPNMTLAQLQDLHALEDRAGTKALWGNVFVFTGVALAAVGGYYLWTDHKNRNTVLAPAPTENGPGVKLVLGGRW
jgi:hypothetical protein